MRFSNNIELLFYAGVGLIIFFFVGVVFARFKDERFDFEEHKWIALFYIILMMLTIWLWRYLFDTFFSDRLLELISPQGLGLYG